MAEKKKKKKETQPITSISVKGFKCFRDETGIELRPLTILAGANSSGKTSIIQPLLLLKQTLECPWDPGPLLLEGQNAKFTSINQVLWKGHENSGAKKFSIQFSNDDIKVKQIFNKSRIKKRVLTLSALELVEEGKKYVWRLSMSSEELDKNIPRHIEDFRNTITEKTNKNVRWIVKVDRCALCISLKVKYSDSDFPLKDILITPMTEFNPSMIDLIHLPGLRGNPSRVYPASFVGESYPGQFQNYVASIIASWKEKIDPRYEDLCVSLQKLGLTCKIEPRFISDTQIELLVGRLPMKDLPDNSDLVSIADVGIGVSQVLPVLVAMLVAEPGQLVYIEQPEIHLHPKARVLLAELIAETANRGVILIIETHSGLLLRALQTLVAKKTLPKEKVILHWFERQKDGAAKVHSHELDEKGAYGDWPVDFEEVDLDVDQDYLEAAL